MKKTDEYDEIVDRCYGKLEKGDNILIKGKIRNNGKIEIKAIKIIDTYTK